MITRTVVWMFTKITALKAWRAEKETGYRLIFRNLAPHWIDAIMTFDMTHVWQKDKLDATGVNYFTIGAIKNGLSERYNAYSPYYQSWLGGYVVKFKNPKEWSVTDHYKLAVSDQKNWLRLYGDKQPYVQVDVKHAKHLGPVTVSGYKGELYEGAIWSDTDVGENNTYVPYVKKKWDGTSPLDSYQKIYLYGYIAIVKIDAHTKAVLYANGAKYTDKTGKKYNTFRQIKTELKQRLLEVKIVPTT